MTAQWYIVHALSGHEAKVAQTIREKIAQQNLSQYIQEVTVPTEEVIEVRRGKKVKAERKFFPGYILVKMEMNDKAWHMVQNIPRVTGFLGANGKPQPLSEVEAGRIFQQMQEGVDHPKPSVTFQMGENVKIVDGPFESFIGAVEEIDEERSRLKLSVSIFGRPTPVELEFTQVEKV